MLDARRLTKYYSAVPAIRDVSFTLTPGTILGLLGPNGSGKSTTVSILTGLLEPSGGRVLFNGIDIRERPLEYRARIGYVPEEAHLYNYLTGPEHLALIGRLRSLPEAALQRKIAAFLDIFGLTDDQHAPMSAYSKGMRQKILISAALLHDPLVIVFDEPNSGLDVTSSLVLRSLVQGLAAEGRMVLYSSHSLEVVEQVATDVLILHEGRVAAHGTVAELRGLMELPSLEQVFRRLVVETDVDGVARHLIEVMKA
ncbi:MAG TPA: ABC transporter ATP-binding protein [Vicinamibacterales bacterium]|nr:ABC transporter ATP-binding protein [Vicinamibacterales bacterium]